MATTVALTPAAIDVLASGRLRDPQTPGLRIEVLPSAFGRSKLSCFPAKLHLGARLAGAARSP